MRKRCLDEARSRSPRREPGPDLVDAALLAAGVLLLAGVIGFRLGRRG
jgi:hypothetical protein